MYVHEEGFSEEEYAIAVNKGQEELLKAINEVLTEMMNNGQINDYTVKFLGE